MARIPTRGLALSAVAALAVTGLSYAAVPAAHAADPGVLLLSQQTGYASLRTDRSTGSSSPAVKLTARVEGQLGSLRFELNPDPEATDDAPGWVELQTSGQRSSGPYITTSWNGATVDGRYFGGERVALRAVAELLTGTEYSGRRNVEVTGEGSPVHALDVSTTSAGYFTQPYRNSGRTATLVNVSGTTSATDGTVALSAWRTTDGRFGATTAAEVTETAFKVGSGTFVPGGRFSAPLDITGFDPADESVTVAAVRGSDDVTAVDLVPQTLDSVSVNAQPVRAGETGQASGVVRDKGGAPVIGAEVRRTSDGSLVGYTDANGAFVAMESAGTTEQYYANSTDADAYDETIDPVSSPVTVATYDPQPDEVGAFSLDGPVFDVDEYSAGDVGVLVEDQENRPLGGADVEYRLYQDGTTPPADYTTATSGDDGVAVVPFDTAGPAGTYVLEARLAGSDSVQSTVTFTAGQATLVVNPKASPVQAEAGGQVDYVGRLVVEGRPLPGRLVGLSYRRGVEVVPGDQADAAMIVGNSRVLRTSVVTNDNGSFRVTVDDAAERPQASETGGVLTAATGLTPATENTTTAGNAGARVTSTTRFGTGGPGRAAITLSGKGNGAKADVLAVAGPTSLAGERVKLFRVLRGGKRVLVTTRVLDAKGDRTSIKVADRNGTAPTTYVAQVVASKRAASTQSGRRTVR